MAKEKGSPKTGGRKVGSPMSIMSANVKERLVKIVGKYVMSEEGVRNLESDLETLRPVDRVAMIEKLMKYCIPTLGSMKVGGDDDDGELNINVNWKKTPPKSDDEDDASDLDYSEDVPE